MKKLYNIKIALVSLMVMASLSSCLKDDARLYDFSNSAPVIDWALVAYKVGVATQTATISGAAATNQVNALLTVQSPNPTTESIAVTVIIDPTAVPAGATNFVLPASTYSIVGGSLNITIPPGTSAPLVGSGQVGTTGAQIPVVGVLPANNVMAAGQAVLSFTLNTAAVKALPAGTYYLPLTISSASGQGVIIDQYKTLNYKIVVGP